MQFWANWGKRVKLHCELRWKNGSVSQPCTCKMQMESLKKKKGGNPLEKFGLGHNEAIMSNGGLFNHQTTAAAGFKDKNLNCVILRDRKCKHRRRKLESVSLIC